MFAYFTTSATKAVGVWVFSEAVVIALSLSGMTTLVAMRTFYAISK